MEIVLDADGVLLHYNEQMAKICEKALCMELKLVRHAHHFHNAYDLKLSPEQKQRVYALFDLEGWNSMPEMQGAIKATQRLHRLGHRLSCLSSMPPRFVHARKENFQLLQMPIDEVIGSDRDEEKKDVNPKAVHLAKMQPDVFVDDQLRNFKDVPEHICKVWINHSFDDCPNVGMDMSLADFVYPSLEAFALEVENNPQQFIKPRFKPLAHKP